MTITVSIRSLRSIITRHNLRPDENNNYRLTGAMIAEAKALDTLANDISTGQKEAPGRNGRTEASLSLWESSAPASVTPEPGLSS
jgi:hypothetical protein